MCLAYLRSYCGCSAAQGTAMDVVFGTVGVRLGDVDTQVVHPVNTTTPISRFVLVPQPVMVAHAQHASIWIRAAR